MGCMKEKRVTGTSRGGGRRHGDPPAWLDETLPLEQRRKLLDIAIRANASVSAERAGTPASHDDKKGDG
jgi:hypothetical protein